MIYVVHDKIFLSINQNQVFRPHLKTSLDREKTFRTFLVSPNILRSLVYRTYIHYVVTAQYSERRYIIGQEARIFSKCARRNAWPQVEKNRIMEFLDYPFTKKSVLIIILQKKNPQSPINLQRACSQYLKLKVLVFWVSYV